MLSKSILDEEVFYNFLKNSNKKEIIELVKELNLYLDADYLLADVMEDLFSNMKMQIAYFLGSSVIDEIINDIEITDNEV